MQTGNGLSRIALLLAAAAALSLTHFGATPAQASATCSKVAAPTGLDSAIGTLTKPFRSAQKLADSLGAGQTGCLRAGTYAGNVKVTASGTAGAPLTIASYPGERAKLAGKLWIAEGANFVTVASLDLDGRNSGNLPSPAVNGDDVTFVDNDVTNSNTTICFNIGATTYGRADRTVIERNRIHNCGELPATNLDHGIYVEHATGTRIVDNLIHDNADRGVQLYPDAQQSYVARNVIDGNGEGVMIAGGSEDYGAQASSDNVIEHNVITNSTQRNNVESFWGSPAVGERNVVRQNCISGGARAAQNQGLGPQNGFSANDNLMADPGFVDRGGKNFELRSDSPCHNLAAYRTPASKQSGTGIVLDSPRKALRAGRTTTLSGHVTGGSPRFVVIRVRRGKSWKRIGKARVGRNGKFKTRVRMRRRSAKRSSVGGVRVSRSARKLAVRATGKGVGSSNTVRVRVGR